MNDTHTVTVVQRLPTSIHPAINRLSVTEPLIVHWSSIWYVPQHWLATLHVMKVNYINWFTGKNVTPLQSVLLHHNIVPCMWTWQSTAPLHFLLWINKIVILLSARPSVAMCSFHEQEQLGSEGGASSSQLQLSGTHCRFTFAVQSAKLQSVLGRAQDSSFQADLSLTFRLRTIEEIELNWTEDTHRETDNAYHWYHS